MLIMQPDIDGFRAARLPGQVTREPHWARILPGQCLGLPGSGTAGTTRVHCYDGDLLKELITKWNTFMQENLITSITWIMLK